MDAATDRDEIQRLLSGKSPQSIGNRMKSPVDDAGKLVPEANKIRLAKKANPKLHVYYDGISNKLEAFNLPQEGWITDPVTGKTVRGDYPSLTPEEIDNVVKSMAAAKIDQSWLESASDKPLSLALQQVAVEKYKTGDTNLLISSDATKNKAQALLKQHRPLLEDYLDSVKAETQRRFKDAGVTHIKVYRGIRFGGKGAGVEGTSYQSAATVPNWLKDAKTGDNAVLPASAPLSSWTADAKLADDFSKLSGDYKQNYVLSYDAPVSDVIGVPGANMGADTLSEIVIGGAHGPVKVVNAGVNPYAPRGGKK